MDMTLEVPFIDGIKVDVCLISEMSQIGFFFPLLA